MSLNISQKIGTTLVGAGLLLTGAFAGAAPAQAVTDPFPNAPVCAVKSDHVTIKLGSSGNSVKEAQCLLNRHGAKLTADGKFGTLTDTAVRNFQRSKGLAVDGVVGTNTWKALISGTGTAPTTRQAKVDKVLKFAKAQLGKRYVWGAEGPNTFDCSGYTLSAYKTIGVTTPRTANAQAKAYRQVSKSSAQPGDLVHWPGHVGIYAGNGKVYHASSSQHKVVLSNVWGTPTYHRVF